MEVIWSGVPHLMLQGACEQTDKVNKAGQDGGEGERGGESLQNKQKGEGEVLRLSF